ncbi:MAG: hypothetical protein KGI37_07555 [Alphaproteobacteria bacterium]|nr:hypothetical protein [Alphaproteobacteria bacterium]
MMTARVYPLDELYDRRHERMRAHITDGLNRERVTPADTLDSLLRNIATFNIQVLERALKAARMGRASPMVAADNMARHAARTLNTIDYIKLNMGPEKP